MVWTSLPGSAFTRSAYAITASLSFANALRASASEDAAPSESAATAIVLPASPSASLDAVGRVRGQLRLNAEVRIEQREHGIAGARHGACGEQRDQDQEHS
jgi:hypothetical protein